ncbi:hypothetical protein ACFQZR_20690 [Paenibacillus sp. GCM10027629]|uniref:hypothetical protein n=1 Tax=Paenibacillus sp. GCM10027629 TaxID=3273414 RepID=UPI00363AF374
MNEVSLFRLYLLRAVYLFLAVGGIVFQWPGVIHHVIYQEKPWEFYEGVVSCMLVAFSLLMLVGIRYPLQMLPVLLWEMIWKSIWLLIVALPLWLSGQIDESTIANVIACSVGLVVPIAMPWSYFFANYIRKTGERWLNASVRGTVGVNQERAN